MCGLYLTSVCESIPMITWNLLVRAAVRVKASALEKSIFVEGLVGLKTVAQMMMLIIMIIIASTDGNWLLTTVFVE